VPKPSCGFSSDRERPIFFLSWANQETTMPGKQAAEKGAGSDAASTPSNYLTIRVPGPVSSVGLLGAEQFDGQSAKLRCFANGQAAMHNRLRYCS
jgi:hypothetical protein